MHTKWLQNNFIVALIALLCTFLWGSAFPFIKIGYQLFNINANDIASIILFAGLRFSLAGILTIIIGSILSKKLLYPPVDAIKKVTWLALLQTILQYLFFYIGLAHTNGVKASIIEAINVFAAIFVASIIFHQEKLNKQKVIGCSIGFIAVILVNLSGVDFNFSLFGEGFIFLSALCYAFSSIYIKRFSSTCSPVMLSGYQFIIGGITLSFIGIIMGGRIASSSPLAYGLLFYLAALSAIAYTLWGILLKHNPVSKVSIYGFMNPVFGVILSMILLHEKSQTSLPIIIISLFAVSFGIYLVNKPHQQ